MMAAPLATADLDHVLEHTREMWDELHGERLFVTGGTGFFGCWLVESFLHVNRELSLGAQMTVLTRDAGKFRAKCSHLAGDAALTLHQGDVRDFEFPAGEFGYVIHAATETMARPGGEGALHLASSIVDGTRRTLEFALQAKARKFLLTSSGAVYGKQPGEMTHVPESYDGSPDPMDAASVYGEGKRAAEMLCVVYQRLARERGEEFDVKIARCWAFVGPHLPLDAHFAIGNFIGDALAGRAIAIGGDGTPRRSYLYAADMAIWLWTMLFRAPALTPINVGAGEDVSIRELADTVAATLAPGTEVRVAKQAIAGAVPSRYVPCVRRAEELLGLRPLVGLEDAIRRTAEWAKCGDSALRSE